MATIPSQPPATTPVAVRPTALQALILQAGQAVEAVVLGTAPNGTTQLQIGQQTLTVSLPTPMPAGTLLNLVAQGKGADQKLVLVQQPAQSALPTLSASSSSMPSLSPRTSSAGQLPPTALPIAPDKLQPLALQAGQRVEARVLGPATNGATRLQIGQQTIEVVLPSPIAAGTVLPLRVQGSGAQQSLMPLPQTAAQGAQPAPLPSGPSLAPSGTTGASVAGAAGTPTGPAATPAAALPSPPQVALTQMVQAAVQQQDSIANLTTMLAAMIGKTPLPETVLRAAGQVLAASLPLGPALDGAALQKAVANSGVFQESALAQGATELAKGDLKTTLLTLRSTLVSWLGQPTADSTMPSGPLPPPVRGASPRGRPAATAPLELPASPAEAGKVLLERTEGSLARLRLHQHASLPETTATATKPADWSMDLPVVIGSYQTVMQLQIHRDEAGSSQAASERGWQIRFAVDLPSLGEVGAQVGLRGGTTSVRLWANDPATARHFEQAAPELASALAAAGLRPGVVMVRADEPVPQRPSTGHFVDSLT